LDGAFGVGPSHRIKDRTFQPDAGRASPTSCIRRSMSRAAAWAWRNWPQLMACPSATDQAGAIGYRFPAQAPAAKHPKAITAATLIFDIVRP